MVVSPYCVGEKVGEVRVATEVTSGPRGGTKSFVAGALKGPRGSGYLRGSEGRGFGRGVATPVFPMFFSPSRRFAGDRKKWPVRPGGGSR